MKYNGKDGDDAGMPWPAKQPGTKSQAELLEIQGERRRLALRGLLIGLCGKAGVGKTLTANAIVQFVPEAIIMPLAQPLKRLARDYFGWDGSKDDRGRALLQHLGTDTGRAWDENFWVKKWTSAVFDIWRQAPDAGIVVDDVRFQNEVDAIHQLGGITVTLVHGTRGFGGPRTLHASETQKLDTTHTVQMGDKLPEQIAVEILGLWGLDLEVPG